MKVIKGTITLKELKEMARESFGDMVKAVVDVDREIIAVDAELHSDLEALLLERGSEQKCLWGINIYTDVQGEGFVEFDSMINVRPSQNNRCRGVEDKKIRKKIVAIVRKKLNDGLSA
jgi:hypothetical protein